jgi:hypothetical protein
VQLHELDNEGLVQLTGQAESKTPRLSKTPDKAPQGPLTPGKAPQGLLSEFDEPYVKVDSETISAMEKITKKLTYLTIYREMGFVHRKEYG